MIVLNSFIMRPPRAVSDPYVVFLFAAYLIVNKELVSPKLDPKSTMYINAVNQTHAPPAAYCESTIAMVELVFNS